MKRGGGRIIVGPHGNAKVEKKDRDEDLLLFCDMQKRDKDRIVSLLNPIQLDDLESNSGNFPLYRIPSAKKFGFEFLNESDKNDYDWLKTPPATPLFTSLEMDAGAPDLVVQRELPILTHLSRFSGNSQEAPKMIPRSKSPNPMAKVLPRSFAQNIRPNVPPPWTDATRKKGPLVSNPITNERSNTLVTTTEHTNPTEHSFNTHKSTKRDLSSNLSPLKLTVVSSESLNETPPNLITNHSSSTSRGRLSNPSIASSARQPTDHLSSGVPSTNRSSSTSKGRPSNPSIASTPRQPIEHPSSVVPLTNRSSSTSRGRPSNPSIASTPRQPTDQPYNHVLSNTTKALEKDLAQSISPPKTVMAGFFDETPPNLITNRPPSSSRGRPTTPSTKKVPIQDPIQTRRQSCSPSMSRGRKPEFSKQEREADVTTITKKKNQGGNGSLAFGSSMVEKVMNARKLGGEGLERKPKFGTTPTNENGRFASKGCMDIALKNKHMEAKRDVMMNIKSASINSSSDPSKRTSQSHEGSKIIQESWKRKETRRFLKN